MRQPVRRTATAAAVTSRVFKGHSGGHQLAGHQALHWCHRIKSQSSATAAQTMTREVASECQRKQKVDTIFLQVVLNSVVVVSFG